MSGSAVSLGVGAGVVAVPIALAAGSSFGPWAVLAAIVLTGAVTAAVVRGP
ncbi:hypothetical protein [Halorarum salinum]|uniref:Uncharacterized protein n=1 Tax=Halorarum salinum TaxID=2743089 RepID=A0A7D5QCK0_9EURY|nr:hypothetical protein [Halobaculum salinum]QLG61581.1 hypothetical protein HUG12_07510 [Halobaculum salinum]